MLFPPKHTIRMAHVNHLHTKRIRLFSVVTIGVVNIQVIILRGFDGGIGSCASTIQENVFMSNWFKDSKRHKHVKLVHLFL